MEENRGARVRAGLTGKLENVLSTVEFFYLAAAFSLLTIIVMMHANVRRGEERVAGFELDEAKSAFLR